VGGVAGGVGEVIAGCPQFTLCLTCGEIIEKRGIEGDKSLEQSISNVRAKLKKAGTIAATDGKYAFV
jgi:hypothetical protein